MFGLTHFVCTCSPHFGIAHALCLGLAPWLAAEIPYTIGARCNCMQLSTSAVSSWGEHAFKATNTIMVVYACS